MIWNWHVCCSDRELSFVVCRGCIHTQRQVQLSQKHLKLSNIIESTAWEEAEHAWWNLLCLLCVLKTCCLFESVLFLWESPKLRVIYSSLLCYLATCLKNRNASSFVVANQKEIVMTTSRKATMSRIAEAKRKAKAKSEAIASGNSLL